jgi:hypothetical protein
MREGALGAPGTELQQLEAEDIVEGRGQQLGLGPDQRPTELASLPLLQYGSRISHNILVFGV